MMSLSKARGGLDVTMGHYGSLPLIPTSSPEFDRLLVEEDVSVDIGGGPMHAHRSTDHPSGSYTLRAPHAPLPDEGAAERIAQRVCTPRGVMIAVLCGGAFYFGGAASAPAGGWGARVDGRGNAGLAMARDDGLAVTHGATPEHASFGGGWGGERYAPRAARVPDGFQHPRVVNIDDAPWTTTTTTGREAIRDSHSRSHGRDESARPRRAGPSRRERREVEERRRLERRERRRRMDGHREKPTPERRHREDGHREREAGLDELERRIRATVAHVD